MNIEEKVAGLEAQLKESTASAEKQIEVLAGEVATLKEQANQLREDVDQARAIVPDPATKAKVKEADKPGIPPAFKVGGKSYVFRYPTFRGALDALGGTTQKIRVDKLNKKAQEEVVKKYPGMVKEAK